MTEEEKQSIADKTKQTCLERYGVEFYSQTEEANQSHKTRYQYQDIMFDSSWELYFYLYHKMNNHNISRATNRLKYTFNGKDHYYFPDFNVDGKLYEIKGGQFWKEGTMQNPYDHTLDALFEAKHLCGLKNGVTFIKEDDMRPIITFVDNVCTNEFIKSFRHYQSR